MKTGKFILGLMVGLAAGAVLGMLYAPDKGTETREKIARKGRKIVDDLKEKANSLINQAGEMMEDEEMESNQDIEE